MLVVSDGLDTRYGLDSTAPGLSLELDRPSLSATAVVSLSIHIAPTVSTRELRKQAAYFQRTGISLRT